MKLGVDSYTLRWQGWDAIRLIEYAAEVGLDAVQLSGRRHFRSYDEADLAPAKRRADELGVMIELSMGSVDRHSSAFRPEAGTGEEQASAALRAAAFLGSPSVHAVLGGPAERRDGTPLDQHVAECVRVARAVAPLALDLGVKLAFETHGDLLGREMVELVEAAGPEHTGVCLDPGNPATMAEDPLMTVELLAKYTVTSHMRDTRIWAAPGGVMVQLVPMGQGSVDWPRVAALLREQAPGATFSLETLSARAPRLLPVLDHTSSFWDAFPKVPARDFARYLALAERGRPEPFEQIEVDPGWSPADSWAPPTGQGADALIAQQRRHFEESVAYCRDVLGLGVRGR